jgi:CHAT domain-containing protein
MRTGAFPRVTIPQRVICKAAGYSLQECQFRFAAIRIHAFIDTGENFLGEVSSIFQLEIELQQQLDDRRIVAKQLLELLFVAGRHSIPYIMPCICSSVILHVQERVQMNVRTAVVGGVVCVSLLTFACHPEAIHARVTEPRLSGFDTWQPCTKSLAPNTAVETAACGGNNPFGKSVSLNASECDDEMRTAGDAVRLIAFSPACTDAAVEKLESYDDSRADAGLLSDLAGAYYVRAQRDDRPSDFVRALAAAERAVGKNPESSAARFNLALAEEALGFSDDAIESWEALHKAGDPGWSSEAGAHYERLILNRSAAAALQWSPNGNKERLPTAAAAHDAKAVHALVAPFCYASRRYLEDEILPRWADAYGRDDAHEIAGQLNLARAIAQALAEISGDHQLLDTVERIRLATHSRDLARLAAAHRAFANARKIEAGLTVPADAAFAQAQSLLDAAASPLRFSAMLGTATALAKATSYEKALELLRIVDREAKQRRYGDLAARVHTGRGYVLMVRGYDIAAYAEYSTAQSEFMATKDFEMVGAVQNIMVGLLRRIGDEILTWQAAYRAQRYLPYLADPQSRHTYLGENALAAAELGYPSIALRYLNLAVRMLERDTTAEIEKRRHNLGFALRARAAIYARLSNNDAAKADLAESSRLLADVNGNPFVPKAFQARLDEAEALRVAAESRPRAIAKLGEAIALASDTYYQSLTASLRLERADLYRQSGQSPAATADLLEAIAILRGEEKAAVEGTRPPADPTERFWSPFFARSQEAYRRLIRLYIEDGNDDTAFKYAERARAYEPLHLVLRRSDLPDEFKKRIRDGEPFEIDDVKETVPAGTYILEYSVLDDRTYVWVISRGFSVRRTLHCGNNTIHRWSRDLQRFAEQRSNEKFETALITPSRVLLQDPLGFVPRGARLVIIPDRAMHGLPFAALRSHHEYLIHDHPVAVAASSTLYAFSLAQDRHLSRDSKVSVLLLANPTVDPNLPFAKHLQDLQSAVAEAGSIGSLYAAVATVKPPLFKQNATVAAFISGAADSTILHLAAHGIANAAIPSHSYLLLAPAGDEDRGVLDAERLLQQLHLTKTRLTVLSACSSAGGTPVGPEGLAPLVRPFVASGVPAVVGTLWSVSDSVATAALLERFHEHYRTGDAADVALQIAQRDMSESPSKARNAVWAWSAFQTYGYASSPFPPSVDH